MYYLGCDGDNILRIWQSKLELVIKIALKVDDIKTAKDIINGKLSYCEECKDYYLTKSFLSEKETIPTKICMYEDPINSGGNDYVDGYADIIYHVCPKGHKHVVDRKERRK